MLSLDQVTRGVHGEGLYLLLYSLTLLVAHPQGPHSINLPLYVDLTAHQNCLAQ